MRRDHWGCLVIWCVFHAARGFKSLSVHDLKDQLPCLSRLLIRGLSLLGPFSLVRLVADHL